MTCVLTGKEVTYKNSANHIFYSLTIADNEVDIFICRYCKNKIKVDEKYHLIIQGLIANGKFPNRSEIIAETCDLEDRIAGGETLVAPGFLQTADYPKTPKEKLEHLFISLFDKQTYDGEQFEIQLHVGNFLLKNYLNNLKEGSFYLRGLEEQGLINLTNVNAGGAFSTVTITHKGLEKAIELKEEGNKSKKCFIAMSFRNETHPVRNAIKLALKETGYEAIIIDEENVDSDKTINDAIIASLKKCKFCIADFSFHSNGVYFESGFALGQGKKVIYTCSEEEFKNAHFDIRPLQHIIYTTPDYLTQALIHKIEAYIN